jgi:hypothetical protein
VNTYKVSLDGSIDDGLFEAATSEDAIAQACTARGWTYSEEVYNAAQWDLVD